MTDLGGFTIQYAIRMPDGNLVTTPIGSEALWKERPDAERTLIALRAQAANIGVRDWAGVVVRRYSTPFISDTDPAENLITDLGAWLKQQSGEPHS